MAGFSRTPSSLLFLIFLLFTVSEAKEFLVGGKSNSWSIPSSDKTQTLNQWAESTRFRIGDTLVWNYDGGKDSVLQVSKEDYDNCNISSPIEEHKDGNTKVKLDRAGAFYFISGAKGHCGKGQKLIVVVLSPRNNRFIGISPAPSPAEFDGPAVAPTSAASSFHGSLVVVLGLLLWGLF